MVELEEWARIDVYRVQAAGYATLVQCDSLVNAPIDLSIHVFTTTITLHEHHITTPPTPAANMVELEE